MFPQLKISDKYTDIYYQQVVHDTHQLTINKISIDMYHMVDWQYNCIESNEPPPEELGMEYWNNFKTSYI